MEPTPTTRCIEDEEEVGLDEFLRSGIDLMAEVQRMMLNAYEDPYAIYRELRAQGGLVPGDVAVIDAASNTKWSPSRRSVLCPIPR